MTKAEPEARRVMGLFGRIPRKRKKQIKKAIKSYIQAEMDCGNWDLIDYVNTMGIQPTAKEDKRFGLINLKGK